jgi:hypothetical protein
MPNKYTYEEVKKDFEEVGYILISTEYVNSHAYLEYICPDHLEEVKKIRYANFKRGQRCINCSSKKRGDLFRISQEKAEEEFQKRGYTLIDKYDTNMKNVQFICPCHPDKDTTMSLSNLIKGHECRFCAFDKLRGENSPSWNGGTSPLRRFFRDMIEEWRVESLIKFDRKCFITGEKHRDLEVHHLFPFYKVRDIVLSKLDINIENKTNRNDFTKEEQERLREELINKHRYICGIPIKKDLHILFHKLYGGDVNYSDLKEFKSRYKRGEFNLNGMEII